jgi:hypothetical protein
VAGSASRVPERRHIQIVLKQFAECFYGEISAAMDYRGLVVKVSGGKAFACVSASLSIP